jgi:hypothetical protein
MFQKGGTAFIERHPRKYPKRVPPGRTGLRPRSHLSKEDRRLFDALAKQYYYDIINDMDGNDRPNLNGILNGSDIPAADAFYEHVYKMMKEEREKQNQNVAAGGAAGGDSNVLLESDNEAEDE